jgi:hypothetical protein
VILAAGLVASASAAIDVSFVPASTEITTLGGTAAVDIYADIPEAEAIVGWGLDVLIDNTGIADMTGVAIGPLFDAALQNPDGDGLAGLVPMAGNVWGTDILLATVTFTGYSAGTTGTGLGDTIGDNTEGFAIDPDLGGGFATAVYGTGSITVIPEPMTLSLLGLALLAIRRR